MNPYDILNEEGHEGNFTSQFKSRKSSLRHLESLAEFADYILAHPTEFKKITRQRANYYNNLIAKKGSGLKNTYKNKFNKKYGFPKDETHSIKEISKLSGYQVKGLQTIYDKGVGAYYTNPQSVRPQVKSPEQWAMARIYAAIDPTSKAHNVDKSHLIRLN
jgi:hypothetical protein